jgi:hypothetical protein
VFFVFILLCLMKECGEVKLVYKGQLPDFNASKVIKYNHMYL